MKKIFSLLVMLPLLMVAFQSCGGGDDEPSGGGSLKGTKWTVTYLGTKYVVEFTSDKDVRSYEADANNNYENYLHEGTYSKNGTQITFNGDKLFFTDVIGLSGCYYYYFRSATVTESTMKLTTEEVYLKINWSSDDYTTESRGTKVITLMKI